MPATTSDELFDLTRRIRYPAGVVPVPAPRIAGLAFFPGGAGAYATDNQPFGEVPRERVMVVGQDFDNEVNFLAAREHGSEKATGPTWNVLLYRLRQAGVDPTECFYTNCFMGLRAGNAQNTNVAPGSRNPDYRRDSMNFMREQLRIIR